jgi:capsular exopolysaccharide synthesis family protein
MTKGKDELPEQSDFSTGAEKTYAAQPEKSEPLKKQFGLAQKSTDEIDFFKYFSIIFRRKKIIFIALLGIVFLNFLRDIGKADLYRAETKLLVQPRKENPIGQYDPGYFFDRQTKINTMLATLKSREILKRILGVLQLDMSVAALSSALEANRIKETDIILVAAISASPERAADIANTMANEFISFNNEINRKDISDALKYIEVQIWKTEKELREKEESLKDYQQKNRIVEISDESDLQMGKLSTLEMALQNTGIEIVENDERLNQLRIMLKREDLYVEQSFTFDNTLEAKLIQLNVELANAQAEYGDEHRRVKFLKESIRQLTDLAKQNQDGEIKISSIKSLNENRQKLLQEYNSIKVEGEALRSRKAAYENVIKNMNETIRQIPEKHLIYRRLKRDKENIEKIYELLQTKFQEQRIRYEMQSADVVQWEAAVVPRAPIPQGSRFDFLIMIFVGLVVGIGIAFIVEYVDQSVKSPQEIEEELNLPLLGVIPLMEEKNKVLALDTKSKILEPYRSLRTNIRYTNLGASKRSILVTSAIQGDGKTTKACNLAVSFAIDGKKVMVVDADLRRSAVHKMFGVERGDGLSEYLTRQRSYHDIKNTVFNGSISVITAGKRPPNPAEILGNPHFKDLLREGFREHDVILIDSPAIVPVSDALLIAPYVDSAVIIGRAMKTPMKAMQYAKNSLMRVEANIIGVVFNGVEQRRGYYPYYYNYYSYYHYYKSRYYSDYDDEESLKLPKNFREFVVFTAKELWEEVKDYRHILKKLAGKPSSIFSRYKRKVLIFSLLAVALGLLAVFLRLFILGGKRGEERLPADFRYTPALPVPETAVTEPAPLPVQAPEEEAGPETATEKQALDSASLQKAAITFLEAWKGAWQAQDLERYARLYSETGFKFRYGGYDEWLAYKKNVFSRTASVRIDLRDISFETLTDSLVVVNFKQLYYTANLKTPGTTRKKLSIVRDDNRWKIYREDTVK